MSLNLISIKVVSVSVESWSFQMALLHLEHLEQGYYTSFSLLFHCFDHIRQRISDRFPVSAADRINNIDILMYDYTFLSSNVPSCSAKT
jgi:hypothetical protein